MRLDIRACIAGKGFGSVFITPFQGFGLFFVLTQGFVPLSLRPVFVYRALTGLNDTNDY